MKKVYISGPMTDIENYNIKNFQIAEAKFTLAGFEVVSPVANQKIFEETENKEEKYRAVMRKDMFDLLGCNCIAMLKGWEYSNGARVELATALVCGLEVFCAETLKPLDAGIQYYFTYKIKKDE